MLLTLTLIIVACFMIPIVVGSILDKGGSTDLKYQNCSEEEILKSLKEK